MFASVYQYEGNGVAELRSKVEYFDVAHITNVKNTLLASLNLFSHKVDSDTLLEYEQLFEGFRCYYKKGITLYHWNNNVLSVLREEERKDIQLVMYHHDNSRNAIFLLLESTIA